MPVEAELTAILQDPEHVRAELATRAIPEMSLYADTYYDRPDRSMDAAGYELRVRTITVGEVIRTVLTYKEPAVADWGGKPEHETTVADPEIMRTIFTGLGLVELISFQKLCENYRFTALGRDLLATVVQIPDLNSETFLELETMAEPDDVPAAHAALRSVLGELGVSLQDLTVESYTDRVAARRASS